MGQFMQRRRLSSAARVTGTTAPSTGATAARRHRHRLPFVVAIAAAAAIGIQSPVLAVIPQAVGSRTLLTTASSGTTVGGQIFANVNMLGFEVMPTRYVTFRLFGPSDLTCRTPIALSNVMLTSRSVNSPAFTTTVAGIHRWTTSYSGDIRNPSMPATACAVTTASVVVTKARTTLAVASVVPSNGSVFASVAIQGHDPTGTITVVLTGPNDPFCILPPVFTSTTAIAGTGTYYSGRFTPRVPGTYRWRASYGGDATNTQTTSPCMNEYASVLVR